MGPKDWYPLTQESHWKRKIWWWWSWITTAGDYEELWMCTSKLEALTFLWFMLLCLQKTFNLHYMDKNGGRVGVCRYYVGLFKLGLPLRSVS